MKVPTKTNVAALVLLVLLVPAAFAAKKDVAGRVVDAGSFGIFVGGKRVATEKFEIQQGGVVSSAKAELRADDGSKVEQKAELRLMGNGNLVHYEWSDTISKSQATVDPSGEFLIERSINGETQKKSEQPFVMPLSSVILDDYFFSQRQVLLWRYLASQCGPTVPGTGCKTSPLQYGVVIPHQQTSSMVTVEYQGLDKTEVRGTAQDLYRFRIRADDVDWLLWMDKQYKVQRISIKSQNVEVVRD